MGAQQLGLDAVCSAPGPESSCGAGAAPGSGSSSCCGSRAASGAAGHGPGRARLGPGSAAPSAKLRAGRGEGRDLLQGSLPCPDPEPAGKAAWGTATFPFVLRPFGNAAKGARVSHRRLRASAHCRGLSVGAGLVQAGDCCKRAVKTSDPQFLCASAFAGQEESHT